MRWRYTTAALLTAAPASAAASTSANRRLLSSSSPTRGRRRPAVHRRPVLNEPHIGAERISRQILLPRVAPVLAGSQRCVAAHGQHRLVARIGLLPSGKTRQIVVA